MTYLRSPRSKNRSRPGPKPPRPRPNGGPKKGKPSSGGRRRWWKGPPKKGGGPKGGPPQGVAGWEGPKRGGPEKRRDIAYLLSLSVTIYNDISLYIMILYPRRGVVKRFGARSIEPGVRPGRERNVWCCGRGSVGPRARHSGSHARELAPWCRGAPDEAVDQGDG